MKLNCKICNKEYNRTGKQALKAVCCSRECLSLYKRENNNVTCDECKIAFHLKPYKLAKHKNHFCSRACMAKWKSINLFGSNNPNFRSRMYDSDGYRLICSDKQGRMKTHHAVAFEALEINKIPKNHHIHHRDCNHLNNDVNNLVLLSISDHQWLHKQYGNATLWAYYNNKIDLNTLVSWSNNKEKSLRLLPLNILQQKEIGVFKSDKLLENLSEIDNQQPIINLND